METAVYTVKIGSRYGSEAKLQKKLAEKVGKNGFAVVAHIDDEWHVETYRSTPLTEEELEDIRASLRRRGNPARR